MVTASERRYNLSSLKYMGLLKEPNPSEPQPPSTYWIPDEIDYSNLTANLNAQRIDR